MDELLSKVWKEPAFFLTHPLAIAAFGRECTRRGVPHAQSPSPRSSAAPAYCFLEGARRDPHGGASSLCEIATFGDPLALHLPQQGAGAYGYGREQEETLPWASSSARVPFDVAAIRRDLPRFPDPAGARQRQATGVVRQRCHHAQAAAGDRPHLVLLRARERQYPPRRPCTGRARHGAYEAARSKVQRFIDASSPDEIIFVRGTTEAINLIARTWGVQNVGEGDEIIVSHLEHHANSGPPASACAPGITAPSLSCAALAWRPRCGRRWPSTTPRTRWAG
ncbi:Cysteine desulfurase [Cupriavidus basilensis]|uniref:Cysteine desulfurase n=1 Tax=Cupriavidus basilensis TaxID=68895 RepID=A0A0C4YLB9_9BURK|nr:Cysteine desulfurase [Cupriavidus basilensis]